jgi:hypothetical protein
MNSEIFIEAIKQVVRDSTVKGTEENLIKPPGRQPKKELVLLSNWYNSQNSDNKKMIKNIIQLSVDASIFHFLCVLDGVATIEDVEEKGTLELYFVKDKEKILLTDPNEEFLHDIYNAEE